jgi:hypothetical protein
MAEELPPVKLAFVIDGEVVDILFTDDRLAAIFLSEPTIVDVTELIEVEGKRSVLVGSNYDSKTKKFSHPSTVI